MAKSLDDRIADEALEWVGTPFVWDQSVKQVGCDCRGLLGGVLGELGRPEATSLYATLRGYRVDRPVPAGLLLEGFGQLFERVAVDAAEARSILANPTPLRPGYLLLLNFRGRPGHMAIATGEGRAVHAYPGRRSAVAERDLRVLLHRFPLHSVWRVRADAALHIRLVRPSSRTADSDVEPAAPTRVGGAPVGEP